MENDLDPLRMLTLAEVAALMQVSEKTLQRMIARRKFSALKLGGQYRVRESELAKWIQGLNEL